MAWIESHQQLARHPKTARLSRALGLGLPQTIGHLHLLWWWALDFAADGDLSGFDDTDIATGAGWDGEPGQFVQALGRSGFLDAEPMRLHDWAEYGGKLHRRREANAQRMKAAREAKPETRAAQKTKRAAHVQRTSAHAERTDEHIENKVGHRVRGQDSKRTEERETAAPAAHAGAGAPPRSEPYAVFLALCEETGADEEAASRSFRSQQLGIAKRLVDDGFAEGDVRECVRYLKSQTWRTGIIDLRTVQAEIGRWSLAGRPAAEPIPIRPGIATGKTRDQESRDALETFLAIANGAPL